eukprot:COSAG03_NODE_9934_length_684_cov_0.943590_1_plen_131_part_10
MATAWLALGLMLYCVHEFVAQKVHQPRNQPCGAHCPDLALELLALELLAPALQLAAVSHHAFLTLPRVPDALVRLCGQPEAAPPFVLLPGRPLAVLRPQRLQHAAENRTSNVSEDTHLCNLVGQLVGRGAP